ncbi:MAG: hypothetical protein AB1649_30725 [Chloroflexota bacterium]
MTLEISAVLLIFLLTVILTVYNHRQAAALNGMKSLIQDFVAMQIRDRRTQHIDGLSTRIDPFEWLSQQVSAELDSPLTITEVSRVVHEVQAVELLTSNGKRVIASTMSKPEILRFDKRMRANGNGKSATDRVASFAARPLLGSGRGIITVERVMTEINEFFDLEAGAVAERIGLKWDNPSRLWFHVVK